MFADILLDTIHSSVGAVLNSTNGKRRFIRGCVLIVAQARVAYYVIGLFRKLLRMAKVYASRASVLTTKRIILQCAMSEIAWLSSSVMLFAHISL